ncbi:hypothetical protein ACFQ1E_08080 [Sphingomonas canadensis]|uniref:Mor transcription activator domain-containing protein n=1 Tax=Sphingomonas canadensis TaxID=1219257 RepID=A0ABW3H7C4_9SPHN|nr:hypothetical protein [Sphingomonas canadensis]MCW3835994.1 hypothetical protein [Sphingomonas canadensis]
MNVHRPANERRELLDEIAAVIGQANVDKLIERLGGSKVYVPKLMPANHEIAVVIGLRAATRLSEYFHLRYLDLPKAHARRQRALDAALNPPDGMTLAQIALAYDYTERHLYRMIAAARTAGDQLDLFGGDPA